MMQGKGKKKRERERGKTEETFGKLYSNCLKSFKKKRKKEKGFADETLIHRSV